MKNRRDIFQLFTEQEAETNKRMQHGIETYRKGDASIRILRRDGSPVKHAKLTISQRTHHFRFGANLFMLDELETDEKNEAYKSYFAQTFNMATLPFYWNTLEPQRGNPRYSKDSPKIYRRPTPDLCLEFCHAHGIEPREHALAYEQFFPEWLYGADTATTKQELERRMQEIAQHYSDKIPTIEVVNEMFWPKGRTQFYDSPDYIEWCFKTAEKYFPKNQLAINESMPPAWEENCRATDRYYAYIEANLLKGARIDAIGMQFHLFNQKENEFEATRTVLNPALLYKHMDLYAGLGKPLQISEVTIPAYSNEEEDEAIQADLLEKLYSIWFSHPNVEQIIYWNLVDGYAHVWSQDLQEIRASMGNMTLGENYFYGGLLRFDLTPKPAYHRLCELIHKKWNTQLTLDTGDVGEASFRGFYGMYDITIEADGRQTTCSMDLSKTGNNQWTVQI